MSPTRIATELAKHHVGLAALTDHNTSLNCPAFKTACEQRGIIPLFGMELQTQEEVHVLCLFGPLETALAFSDEIAALLPRYSFDPAKLGDQVYVDADENILGTVGHYLRVSADIGLDALASRVHDLGGLVIPAHADRSSFSLLSQFGYIPEGPWDAIEVVGADTDVVLLLQDRTAHPLIQSSDAHYPEDIAQRCTILEPAAGLLTSKGIADIGAIKRALPYLLPH
jgi:PHP family Zn ribbon phosphoesterase